MLFCTIATILVFPPTVEAAAQPNQSFELAWNSPSGCPQQLEVTDQIRTMLGAAPGTTLPSGLNAKGVIEPVDTRFQLTLTVKVGPTERSRIIVSDDCTSLGKAAAIVLGLLIRREHESGKELSTSDLGSDFREPTAPSAPSEPSTSTLPPAPTQTRDEPTQRKWHLLVMAPTATVDYFTLPKVGLGFTLGAGLRYESWRAFVTGTLWRTQHLTRPGIETYTATFERKSVEAWGCRGWSSGDFELSPCALVSVDFIDASASGDRLTTQRHQLVHASAGAGLLGFWHITQQIGLFFAASGRVASVRSEFVVKTVISSDDAHTVPWGTTLTSIGSEWIF
jgi:hypothetical protein